MYIKSIQAGVFHLVELTTFIITWFTTQVTAIMEYIVVNDRAQCSAYQGADFALGKKDGPCERPSITWHSDDSRSHDGHHGDPIQILSSRPVIEGEVLFTTNTGGILQPSNSNIVVKWFDVSSRSSNAVSDIVAGHMVASSQRDKKGCIHVGPLLEGIYEGMPVMFYTMPRAKMDLLDWLEIHQDVSDAEWAKNFASVLSIFVAVATNLYEMHYTGNRVIHTDIKPENIALMQDVPLTPNYQQLQDVVMIIDLDGCIEYDASVIKLVTPVGTEAYLAPEMRALDDDTHDDDTDTHDDTNPSTTIHGYPCGTFTDAWLLGMLLLVLINRNVFFIQSNASYESRKAVRLVKKDLAKAHKFIETHDIPNVNKTAIKEMLNGFLDPDYKSRVTLEEIVMKHHA